MSDLLAEADRIAMNSLLAALCDPGRFVDRAPSQRELDMRIGSAVAVRAVHDARIDLTAGNREIVRLRAELDALEKHRPAILGALRARLAASPHQSAAEPYRAALMALRGTEDDDGKDAQR